VALVDLGVDTWDAYLSGGPGSHYSFVDSMIDEMAVSGQVHAEVDRSVLYADWLALRDEAARWVRDSTIGALSLVGERADLATSQVKVDGTAQAHFQRVRFDCGMLARGSSRVTVEDSLVPPTYATATDHAHLTGLVHI
jgi:hypothetical protein